MMKIIISVILIVITFFISVGMTKEPLGEKGETDYYPYYDEKGQRTIPSPAYFSNRCELQYRNIYYITLWKEEKEVGGVFNLD